jgi:hypothetical protein
MLPIAQVVTLSIVAIAMACAVGHALELPGKLRLSEDAYRTVQPIYYPGFTLVGGFAELVGMLATWTLAFITPRTTAAFSLTLVAAVALLLMHAIFWLFTQPVNRFWLREQSLGAAGRAFFGTADGNPPDWQSLRDRWEYSHLARAILSLAALVLLASAIAAS